MSEADGKKDPHVLEAPEGGLDGSNTRKVPKSDEVSSDNHASAGPSPDRTSKERRRTPTNTYTDFEYPITFGSVSKTYKNVLGLNHVNINIRPGVTGLLGPNGSGKSTFIKLALGLVHPTAGEIRVLGVDPRNDPYLFTKVGFCPETESFYPGMTGSQYLAFFLRLQGLNRDESEARSRLLLDRLELGEAADRKVQGYSKGMKQKLKIARAISFDPQVIFLDEPLQGADPKARHLIIKNIHTWEEQGKTIIVSSHILSEVERMTQRVVLINKGRILAYGRIRDLRDKLEQFPHKVRIVPRPDEDTRELASMLVKDPDVTSVSVESEGILAETKSSGRFFRSLPVTISNSGIRVEAIFSEDENLEQIYEYLMRGGF